MYLVCIRTQRCIIEALYVNVFNRGSDGARWCETVANLTNFFHARIQQCKFEGYVKYDVLKVRLSRLNVCIISVSDKQSYFFIFTRNLIRIFSTHRARRSPLRWKAHRSRGAFWHDNRSLRHFTTSGPWINTAYLHAGKEAEGCSFLHPGYVFALSQVTHLI